MPLRLLFCVLASLLPWVSQAKPLARIPIEAEITSDEVPGGIGASSSFARRVEIDGDWLAVSEETTDQAGTLLKIHLFQRGISNGKAAWTWKQVLDIGAPISFDQVRPAFDLDGGRLVVAAPFPLGIRFFEPDPSGAWQQQETLSEVDGVSFFGSSFMRFSGNHLFLPDPADGGKILVLDRDPGTHAWSLEASIPWERATSLGDTNPSSFDTDGESLILSQFEDNDTDGSSFHVRIFTRASGWEEGGELEAPRGQAWPIYGVPVAIRGNLAWAILSGSDALGNPGSRNTLLTYRKIGKRWLAPARGTISPLSNQVAAGPGLTITFGAATSLFGGTLAGPAGLRRPPSIDVGEAGQTATGLSIGTSGLFATSTFIVPDLDPGTAVHGTARIYRDPFAIFFR